MLGPDAWRRLRDAMRLRALDAWEAIFETCTTSDYLAGREDLPAVDLWTVIEKLADRIAAGKYRTHPAPTAVARPTALPGAEDFAAVRASLPARRAQAAAEWAEVRAKQAAASPEAATAAAPLPTGGPH